MKRSFVFLFSALLIIISLAGCGKSPVGVTPETPSSPASPVITKEMAGKMAKVSGLVILTKEEMKRLSPVSGEAVLCTLASSGAFTVSSVSTPLAADASFRMFISPEAEDKLFFVRANLVSSSESLRYYAPVMLKAGSTAEVVTDISEATTLFSSVLADLIKDKMKVDPEKTKKLTASVIAQINSLSTMEGYPRTYFSEKAIYSSEIKGMAEGLKGNKYFSAVRSTFLKAVASLESSSASSSKESSSAP